MAYRPWPSRTIVGTDRGDNVVYSVWDVGGGYFFLDGGISPFVSASFGWQTFFELSDSAGGEGKSRYFVPLTMGVSYSW